MLILLTVALSAVRFITVKESFENGLESAVQGALKQHRVISYSVVADVRSLDSASDKDEVRRILDTLEDLVEANFDTSIKIELMDGYDTKNNAVLNYHITGGDDARTIEVWSDIKTKNRQFRLTSASDITGVYNETVSLSHRYTNLYLIADMICAVIVVLLALSVTIPIRKISRASKEMAAGNYDVKIPVRRNDELGELSASFVKMKDSVTDTMDQLELASRQKDDFVGNFAHELKTPMTSIIGYADVIYSGNLSESEMREAAGYILSEGMRLETLSFKLLELITVKEGKFILEDTDAGMFFDDTEETVIPVAVKKNMNIRFRCESAYIRIEYDLFKTMVMNLIDNAFKSGGTLVEVTGRVTDRGYEVCIRDNGRGIPEEEIDRITEAFYMIDKARSRRENGAGLGLALCERVARLHNTTLKFESKVGEGTSVSVVVELSKEQGS